MSGIRKTLQSTSTAGKRVLIRADLNVPLQDGKISADHRIIAALDAIRQVLNDGGSVLLMSHLGRPQEGHFDSRFSLQAVAQRLSQLLSQAVPLISDYLTQTPAAPAGSVSLLENVRFNVGESSNDSSLAARYAALADIYVMDAFGSAHRAHASTEGVIHHAKEAVAGPLLAAEISAAERLLKNPARPLVAIVGGAKVSTKLGVLESLLEQVDQLIPGGGIANTFLAAAGFPVGRSLYEPDMLAQARQLLQQAEQAGRAIPLPQDVVVGEDFLATASGHIKALTEVGENALIMDIGPQTTAHYAALMAQAGTIIWNGPVGVFEFPAFSQGTRQLGEAIASSKAYSVAGGGDTLAAVEQYQLGPRLSYLSTGGGAFLELLEGRTLPAIAALAKP